MLRVAQLLPRLHEGGDARGVVDLTREHRGAAEHIVLGESGRFAAAVINGGGRFFPAPLASKNPLTAPWRAMRLRRLLRAIAPDIVHVRNRAPAWLHYLSNRAPRLPTVATAHGINSVNFYGRVMTFADAVICPGIAVAEHLRKSCGAKNVAVIARGVDAEYFNPAAARAEETARLREEWDLTGKKVILHVGRLSKQKGHEILLHALAKLPREYVALVVGDGPQRRRLAELARRLGVAERARFVGARIDMREIYALADVAASCAIKPESFGRAMAEALAMGVPVVAADHGGARDIISADERGGRLIPFNDSAALAAALVAPLPDASESRARIKARFSAKKMAAETMAVYQKVLSARNAHSQAAE